MKTYYIWWDKTVEGWLSSWENTIGECSSVNLSHENHIEAFNHLLEHIDVQELKSGNITIRIGEVPPSEKE